MDIPYYDEDHNRLVASNVLQDGDGGLPVVQVTFSLTSNTDTVTIYANDYGDSKSYMLVVFLNIDKRHGGSPQYAYPFSLYGCQSGENNGYLATIVGLNTYHLLTPDSGQNTLVIYNLGTYDSSDNMAHSNPREAYLDYGMIIDSDNRMGLYDTKYSFSGNISMNIIMAIKCIKLW